MADLDAIKRNGDKQLTTMYQTVDALATRLVASPSSGNHSSFRPMHMIGTQVFSTQMPRYPKNPLPSKYATYAMRIC